MFRAVRNADLVQHRFHTPAPFAGRQRVIQQRQLDVAVHRQFLQQVEGLEDHADVRLADFAEPRVGRAAHFLAKEQVAAGRGTIEETNDVQQR
jgi:hypothetical protein